MLKTYLDASSGVGEIVYVFLLVLAVVLMPFAVMPLIPVAAATFGPLVTGLLSILGWSIGGMIAFMIARHWGRPLLSHFLPLEKLDRLVAMVPQRGQFLLIVLLRLTMPVDLVSYALGLSNRISFLWYTIATVVGVSWFSFAFAYLGEALYQGNLLLLIELAATSALVLIVAILVLRKKYFKKN